jgi:hypothetical protein
LKEFDLRLFVISGKNLVEIPVDSSTNLADWLQRNHFSSDDRIMVLSDRPLSPGQPKYQKANFVDKETPSPYSLDFEDFRTDLRFIFDKYSITKDTKWETISEYITETNTKGALGSKMTKMRAGEINHFSVAEDTLIKWQTEIEYRLAKPESNRGISPKKARERSIEIGNVFNEQYDIYGYTKENSLYLPARLALYKIARILRGYNYVRSGSRGVAMDEFISELGFNPHFTDADSWHKDYLPDEDVWNSIVHDTDTESSKVNKYLVKKGATTPEIGIILEQLQPIIDSFIEKVTLEKKSRDLLDDPKYNIPDGPRKSLIQRIINCPGTDILKTYTTLTDLSKVLFNHPDYDRVGGKHTAHGVSYLGEFLRTSIAMKRPDINVIFPLLVRASQLSVGDFKEKISPQELVFLKQHISDTVFDFMTENGYISPRGLTRYNNPLFVTKLYDTIQKVHIAATIRSGNAYITVGEGSKLFKISDYSRYLSKGMKMNPKTVERISLKLNEFIVDTLTESGGDFLAAHDEVSYYMDALISLGVLQQFTKTARETYLESLRIGRIGKDGYSHLFKDQYYKAWNVMVQGADLFFTDPLSLWSLEDKIFDASDKTEVFAPHHMEGLSYKGRLGSMVGKDSLALYDQILTNGHLNPTYETVSRADELVLKNGLRELLQLGIDGKGSALGGYVNEDDIIRIFRGKTFSVNSRRDSKYVSQVPILTGYVDTPTGRVLRQGLWDYHFAADTGKYSLDAKLKLLNGKIKDFKDKLQITGDLRQAYLAVLSKYEIGFNRFYGKATQFANNMQLAAYLKEEYRQRYPLSKLGNYLHIDLTKVLFDLDDI